MRVVVVGGGIVGALTAYYLTERGVKVTLLDKKYFTYGSTGRSTGSFTAQQHHPVLVRAALKSIERVKELKRRFIEMRIPFAYRFMDDESPHIAVALSDDDAERLERDARVWSGSGAEVVKADPERITEYVPFLNTDAVRAAFITPKDYKAMPHPVTWASIAAARLNGAETRTYEEVARIEREGDSVTVVTSNGRRYVADAVVLAAGAATPTLASSLGDRFNGFVKPHYAGGLVTEPFKYVMKATVRVIKYSYRFTQTVRREFVATIDDMKSENPDLDTSDSLEFIEKASTITVKLMPVMKAVNILRVWGAYVDVTADKLPIIGWSPNAEYSVYYAFGFNDYGLSTAPYIAELIADEVGKGIRHSVLDSFRPTRALTQ